MKKIILISILILYHLVVDAQVSSTQEKEKKSSTLTFQPVVFYTPETGLAVGGLALFQKHFFKQNEAYRKSNIFVAATYSFNDQILIFVAPDIFFPKEKWRFRGKFGFNKTVNRFWGFGNTTPDSNEEEVSYNQIQIEPSLYHKITANLFVGLQYRFYEQDKVDVQDNGILFGLGNEAGADGYSISGTGPALLFDNRKNQINSDQGWYLDASSTFHNETLGSNYDFDRYLLDIRKYIKLHSEKHHVLGIQGYGVFTSGEIPWNQLGELGGNQLRGYFRGRFRDKNMLAMQAEYRSPILFWRISAVGFTGVGGVKESISEFSINDLKPSYGAGLRVMLNKAEKLNIRFDVAFGEKGNSGIYVGLKEAF